MNGTVSLNQLCRGLSSRLKAELGFQLGLKTWLGLCGVWRLESVQRWGVQFGVFESESGCVQSDVRL